MKKIPTTVFACIFLIFQQASAQKQFIASAIMNRGGSDTLLKKHFSKFSLFNINAAEIADYTKNKKGAVSDFELVLPGFENWNFSLTEHDILSKDYTLTVNGPNGKSVLPRPASMTYEGFIGNSPANKVRLTLDNDFIYGIVKNGDKEYYIEPLRYFSKQASNDQFVIYDKEDVVPDPSLTCGVTETFKRRNNLNLQRLQAGTNCVQTQLAIASDASMYTRYGSAAAVQNHNIGVMNNVIWDYVNAQFNDNIEFVIVAQNVSTSVGTDQLSPADPGTNAYNILPKFTTWGEAGNFGVTYDLGQFWTTRNIDGDGAGTDAGIVGLAYIGEVCSPNRYHILEDFGGSNPTGSGYKLRVLTSHEIGHNFNCSHDASNSGFIMQPSVDNTITWSPASIASVNSYVPGLGCLADCDLSGVPVTNFIGLPEGICTGATIQLADHSLQGPTSWAWTMTGGSPASSSIRNPTVSYATSGVKTISLVASNGNGTGTLYSKNILVSNTPATACVNSGTISSEAGIKMFVLNNINKVSGNTTVDGNKYMDFSCSDVTSLTANTTYTALTNVGYFSATNPTPPHIFNHILFYIDYNNDGDFADANENVYSSGSSAYVGERTFTFTTPVTPPVTNQFLRARLIARDFGGSISSCHDPAAGQVEDYSVYFLSGSVLPVSLLDFSGHNQNGKNILNWQTANETDNNHFDIETSKDGNNYYKIGTVAGKGNSSSVQDYTFTDRLPAKGKNYYRLKQVEY
ncbi:MAG: M12 family metallo-peptidase [Chitinophagaceae bacterium]